MGKVKIERVWNSVAKFEKKFLQTLNTFSISSIFLTESLKPPLILDGNRFWKFCSRIFLKIAKDNYQKRFQFRLKLGM